MQDLKVTIAQVDQAWEDKQGNLSHFEEVLKDIDTTDLIVFPEMFHTGFSMNARELAEDTGNSMALNWLRKMAAAKNAAIYTSFIARDGQAFFNRGAFVQPNGEAVFYDKRKRFAMAGEHETYEKGDKAVVVPYKGWNINLQICYDLRFPEISRNKLDAAGKPSYDLCLYVANWPDRRIEHWKALLPARAIENQCYVIGVNRVGVDANDLVYSGESAVYDPLGKSLSNLSLKNAFIDRMILSADDLKEVREKLPFLKDQ